MKDILDIKDEVHFVLNVNQAPCIISGMVSEIQITKTEDEQKVIYKVNEYLVKTEDAYSTSKEAIDVWTEKKIKAINEVADNLRRISK